MKNDSVNTRLRELNWQRPLTEAEQAELSAWFASHPEAKQEWEDDAALSRLLERLPNAPVASNFTARVMDAVGREQVQPARQPFLEWSWIWRVFVPRLATAMLVMMAGVFAYHRHEVAQRKALAQSIVAVADVRSLPSPQFLQDFDAIRRLNPTPSADKELLALLQ